MSVYGVKVWKDSEQNVHGGYLISVEFQGIFSFFLDFALSFEFSQWYVLLRNRKKIKKLFSL